MSLRWGSDIIHVYDKEIARTCIVVTAVQFERERLCPGGVPFGVAIARAGMAWGC